MKRLITCLIALLIITEFAAGQFNIKIPKLKKSKNPVAEKSGTSFSGAKQRQNLIDDGFTFFKAEPVVEYDRVKRGRLDTGWTLESYIRVLGKYPNRSGYSVAVKRGGRVLAKTRCEGKNLPEVYDRDVPGDKFLVYKFPGRGCLNKKKVVKGEGKFDVDVFVFNGDTDEETLLKTYKIEVRRAPRVRGTTRNPQPDAAHYYISRHGEVTAGILYLRQPKQQNYFLTSRSDGRADANLAEIYFSYSPVKGTNSIPDGYLRCSVNGSPVKLPGQQGYADAMRTARIRNETAIYTDRLAAQYKTGAEYRDDVSFNVLRSVLPVGWGGRREHMRINILEKDGDWKCSYKVEGETVRTFHWQVAGGKIVPLPEQTSGAVNLYTGGYLVLTEIPPGGSEYDHRLAPVPNVGFFYGNPWKSAAGRAMAAKVPRKGRPFHVPSNRAK